MIKIKCRVFDYRENILDNEFNCGTGKVVSEVPDNTIFMLVQNHTSGSMECPTKISDIDILETLISTREIHGGVLVNSGENPIIFFH
jgi:hypothetical protein